MYLGWLGCPTSVPFVEVPVVPSSTIRTLQGALPASASEVFELRVVQKLNGSGFGYFETWDHQLNHLIFGDTQP